MKIKTGKQILESGAQDQLDTGNRKVLELNEVSQKRQDIRAKIEAYENLDN